MKKSIVSIMIAFVMFFQTTAYAYSNEMTNETVNDVIIYEMTNETAKDAISYIIENSNSFTDEAVATAELNQNIEFSQEELNQINALSLQMDELTFFSTTALVWGVLATMALHVTYPLLFIAIVLLFILKILS